MKTTEASQSSSRLAGLRLATPFARAPIASLLLCAFLLFSATEAKAGLSCCHGGWGWWNCGTEHYECMGGCGTWDQNPCPCDASKCIGWTGLKDPSQSGGSAIFSSSCQTCPCKGGVCMDTTVNISAGSHTFCCGHMRVQSDNHYFTFQGPVGGGDRCSACAATIRIDGCCTNGCNRRMIFQTCTTIRCVILNPEENFIIGCRFRCTYSPTVRAYNVTIISGSTPVSGEDFDMCTGTFIGCNVTLITTNECYQHGKGTSHSIWRGCSNICINGSMHMTPYDLNCGPNEATMTLEDGSFMRVNGFYADEQCDINHIWGGTDANALSSTSNIHIDDCSYAPCAAGKNTILEIGSTVLNPATGAGNPNGRNPGH